MIHFLLQFAFAAARPWKGLNTMFFHCEAYARQTQMSAGIISGRLSEESLVRFTPGRASATKSFASTRPRGFCRGYRSVEHGNSA